MTATQLAEVTGGRLDGVARPDLPVTGPVTADSRQAGPGALFVALRGERVDGHDFAGDAHRRGAALVLASRPVGVPSLLVEDQLAALGLLARAVLDRAHELSVVAVTGSSGKTSTKDLLAAVLGSAGPTVAPVGSYNNELGVPLTALRVDAGTRFLVAEMGARGRGHIASLCAIAPPDVGIVLNVGAAHAGEFGSREATAAAKGELVEALPPTGTAVLNADDRLVAAMAVRTRARVLTFGSSAAADVRPAALRLDPAARASFDLVTPAGRAAVRLALHGAHHVGNALAAAAAGLECGLSPDGIAAALSAAVPASRWRMEVRTRADGVVVVNDAYNANPDSVRAAATALAAMAPGERAGATGRRWLVLGEMLELGQESVAEHQEVGHLAARLGLDRVVTVGPVAARAAAAAGSDGVPFVAAAPDVDDALAVVAGGVRPGDIVLVKASRSVGLDRLASALLDERADAPAASG